ncbi:MAG: ABC transporter ATP-binding protein [Bacteroidota bacterium]
MLLKAEQLTKTYGSPGNNSSRIVLDHLGFEMNAGDTVAITGPSGSGKTTLLNILGSLDRADSGEVYLSERKYSDMTASDLALFRSARIGFVFQLHHLLPQCTLRENVLIPAMVVRDKEKRKLSAERADRLMKRLGVWEQRHQKPSELSGGECQRTAVIRALINSPEIIFADEPTGALDEENALGLAELLEEINREEKVSIVMVTHSPTIAARMKTVYELRHGKLHLAK